ncbi:MAG: response regulator transcription factor [Gemmatimonadaceae bacterium]|nr:response regulator transcription factor [Gemmatimonadaceae bacterium]
MTADVLRVAIAEDEPLARRALRRMLQEDPAVTLVAEVHDVPALAALLRTTPALDVLFADVRMPGGTVFDCLPLLSPDILVVFTTAHAEHAATAFDLDAVDYLRKPFGARRVHEALERIRRRRQSIPARTEAGGHLLVRVGVRDVPVRLASVWRFEGADDCVRVVTADRTLLHSTTLHELERALASEGFLRIHRRHLVNTGAIRALVPHDAHRLAIELPNGKRVVASRRGTAVLRAWSRSAAGRGGADQPGGGAGGTRS